MSDARTDEMRDQVRKQLKARRDFWTMAIVFVIVWIILAGIWYFTTGPGTYFWPAWAYLGMGIALVFSALSAFTRWGQGVTESDVDAEIERRSRRGA
ncbi:MAG: 2TM domain-containing protein [Actinomycetales bacterium]|nr:2TM domain-containing protein [Actinomycetales bacterium]